MFWRVVDLEAPGQASRLRGLEGLVEAGESVDVQVVHGKHDRRGVRVLLLGALGATFSDKKASLEADQHRTHLGVGEKIGAMGVAKLVGAKATDTIEAASDIAAASASRFAPALRIASAGTAIFGTVTMAHELLDEA